MLSSIHLTSPSHYFEYLLFRSLKKTSKSSLGLKGLNGDKYGFPKDFKLQRCKVRKATPTANPKSPKKEEAKRMKYLAILQDEIKCQVGRVKEVIAVRALTIIIVLLTRPASTAA